VPPGRAYAELVAEAGNADVSRAVENQVWIIRDVAGRTSDLVSNGSSGIVDPGGVVARPARQLSDDFGRRRE
jgi:hypothetical protein